MTSWHSPQKILALFFVLFVVSCSHKPQLGVGTCLRADRLLLKIEKIYDDSAILVILNGDSKLEKADQRFLIPMKDLQLFDVISCKAVEEFLKDKND